MKRKIVQTRKFEQEIISLINKQRVGQEDFEDFKKELAENPKKGAVIQGTGGIRKVRLKSSSGGKSGGFRVCYLDLENQLILFLLYLYPKNEKEDLSQAEKKALKKLASEIKGG